MQVQKNAAGAYEALTIVVKNAPHEDPNVPYFDLNDVASAVLKVRMRDGNVKEFALDILDQETTEGGSQVTVQYVPTPTDFSELDELRAYVLCIDADDNQFASDPFPINVVGRF